MSSLFSRMCLAFFACGSARRIKSALKPVIIEKQYKRAPKLQNLQNNKLFKARMSANSNDQEDECSNGTRASTPRFKHVTVNYRDYCTFIENRA